MGLKYFVLSCINCTLFYMEKVLSLSITLLSKNLKIQYFVCLSYSCAGTAQLQRQEWHGHTGPLHWLVWTIEGGTLSLVMTSHCQTGALSLHIISTMSVIACDTVDYIVLYIVHRVLSTSLFYLLYSLFSTIVPNISL